MSELAWKSATELATMIRARRVGSRELLDHYIDRVERHDNRINAVVVRDFGRARAAADAADAATARGESTGPLHGVPMTVKESFDLAGLPTTWGVPQMKQNIPTTDGVVPQRLKDAGAVIFGKTNVPLMLSDFQSYNDIYGTTHNPHAHGHTPGGSSGGGAAALAAGFTALEYGSDIGGSIRNPAHYSGVCGHKSTWGIVPMRGHALTGGLTPPDISVIGPLARSIDDLELALDLTAGPDRLADPGWRLDLPPSGIDGAEGLRVALWLDDPIAPVDDSVKKVLRNTADALADAGAIIDADARPDFSTEHCMETYMTLLHAAMAARLPEDIYQQGIERAAALSDDDTSPGAAVLRAQTIRYRGWAAANEARTRMRHAWADFFDSYDVLICPVASVPAFPHDESAELGARTLTVNGQPVPYFQQLFWAGMTGVSYLPSTVVPGGMTAGNLPVGVQVVGPEMGDRRTLGVARVIESLTGGFQAPAGFE